MITGDRNWTCDANLSSAFSYLFCGGLYLFCFVLFILLAFIGVFIDEKKKSAYDAVDGYCDGHCVADTGTVYGVRVEQVFYLWIRWCVHVEQIFHWTMTGCGVHDEQIFYLMTTVKSRNVHPFVHF